jgi:hypothetical protein
MTFDRPIILIDSWISSSYRPWISVALPDIFRGTGRRRRVCEPFVTRKPPD